MIAVYGWFLLILLALIVAALRLFRHGHRGLGRSAMLLGGILLLGAWVSTVIGCHEIQDYTQRPAFWVSLGIGAAGLIMAGLGLRRIPPAKPS